MQCAILKCLYHTAYLFINTELCNSILLNLTIFIPLHGDLKGMDDTELNMENEDYDWLKLHKHFTNLYLTLMHYMHLM